MVGAITRRSTIYAADVGQRSACCAPMDGEAGALSGLEKGGAHDRCARPISAACAATSTHRRRQNRCGAMVRTVPENGSPTSAQASQKKRWHVFPECACDIRLAASGAEKIALIRPPYVSWARSAQKKVNETSRASCALTRFSCTLRD